MALAPQIDFIARPSGIGSSRAADRAAEAKAANEFETAFVAEMLAHAGLDKALSSRSGFGGEAMAGLLVREYAAKIVERGGFGLSELIVSHINRAELSNAE